MTLSASALLYDPVQADISGHCDIPMLPRYYHDEGLGDEAFEAESHSFCGHCLRFTTAVTRSNARLVSGCRPALPGGFAPHRVTLEGFCASAHHVLLHQACPGAM
jgi:hypothetical protein